MNKGWAEAPLEDVCSFINRGGSPKYIDTGGIAVINQKCVRDHVVSFALARRHDVGAKSVSPERYLRVGDVLVNSTGTGTLGRVAQVRDNLPEPTTVDSHVTIVRPANGMFVPEFFGYAMVSIESEIQSGGEGCGGQTELARSKLAHDYRIKFPKDHAEQKRIVAILDQAFKAIDTARANAEKNALNAQKLFDSYLGGIFARADKGWVSGKLSSFCREITVGHVGSMAKRYVATGIPFLRSQNIRPFEVSLDNVVYIDRQFDASLGKSRLQPGDVAIVRTGYPGTAAVIPDTLSHANCADLVIVRPLRTLNPHFLAAFFNSSYGRSLVGGKLVGAAQKHFNVTSAKEATLHVPPVAEQKDIADRIGVLRTEADRLGAIYQRKASIMDWLRASVMSQAFGGYL